MSGSGSFRRLSSSASQSRPVRKLSHRPPVPRSRLRRLIGALSFGSPALAVGGMTVMVLTGCAIFGQFLLRSDYFEIDRVEIVTSDDQLREVVDRVLREDLEIAEGMSLHSIDANSTREALTNLPSVATAEVRKLWPNHVIVFAEPRKAVGILVTSSDSLLYDANGLLFRRAKAADFSDFNMPILSGFEQASLKLGDKIPRRSFNTVRRWTEVMERKEGTLPDGISEYYFNRDDGLTLVMASGLRVRCGTRPPEEAGPILEAIYTTRNDLGFIEEINLLTESHITLTRRTALAQGG